MKITDVEAITLSVPIKEQIAAPISIPHADEVAKVVFSEYRTTLVRICTDEGICGVGEAMVRLAPTATRDIVDYLKPLLVGKDPFRIEHLWDLLYATMMNRGHLKGFFVEALSGIDTALWDIKGKALGVPVYELLGGLTNPTLRAYASSLRFRPKDIFDADVQRFLDRGYDAMKMKIGRDPDNWRAEIDLIHHLRDLVGSDVTIMVDVNCGYHHDLKTAMAVGRELVEAGVYWYEEPLSPDNVAGYAALRDKLDIRIAAGEAEYLRYGFRTLFDASALDIVQPNASRAGGISETKRIADMASAHHVAYAPHTGSSSAVAMAVALHLAAAMPNFLIYEQMQSDWSKDQPNPLRWDLVELPIAESNGKEITLKDTPGLGIELNEEVVRKHRVA